MPRQAPAAKPVAGIHYRGDVNAKHEFHGHGASNLPNGERYEGEFRNGKKDGRGTYTWPSGQCYEGEFLGDEKHGRGVLTLYDGERYEGEFENGKWHGHGTYTWPSGQYYKGEFRNNDRHGTGTQTWQNGKRYRGEFQDDKQHGYGIMTFENDDKHVGEWRDNVPDGPGKRIYQSGHSVLTHWLDFKSFEGETYYNFGDGTCYMGQTKGCLPHGQGVLVHGSNTRYAGEWVHGMSGAHTIRMHRNQWSYDCTPAEDTSVGAACKKIKIETA